MVDTVMTAADVVARCKALKDYWRPRNNKFKDWYAMLLLEDKLAQQGMESFVSNDPRTSYNLVLHLLSQPEIPHRVPVETIPDEVIPDATKAEESLTEAWHRVFTAHRRRGRKSWKREFMGLMLATGWYSVFAMVTDNECIAEIWHPAEVFPMFGESGMTECAHIFPLTEKDAKRMIIQKRWILKYPFTGPTTLCDYWFIDDNGSVANSIVIANNFVKEPVTEPKFDFIPIFTSPVGGLPDRGSITTGDKWKGQVGESFLSANEKVLDSYNRQWTFAQQMLRDTAQTRWLELSQSQQILKPADMYKRGAIFKGRPGDKVEPLPVPPIPVELRADRIDMENMLQRGGTPWAVQGSIQQAMSVALMSQVAAAAQQSFGPYHEGAIDMFSDIDNFWLAQIKKHSYRPYGLEWPKLPEDVRVTAEYSVRIPGDLVARATVARMLDPKFSLSETTVMDMQFPEIKNIMKEQARRRKDEALRHPINAQIDLIKAFRAEAANLRKLKDDEGAKLYEKAAAVAEAMLTPPQPEAEAAPPRTRPEEAAAPRGPRGPEMPEMP